MSVRPGGLIPPRAAPVGKRALFFLRFFLLHALGCTSAGFGRAAEGGVVTALAATVLEFGYVTLGMAGDCDGGVTALARMSADQFGGFAVRHKKLRTLHSLLHARYPDGFALAAHHRHAVVGFEGVRFLLGSDSKHHLVFAAFHRLHRLGVVLGAGGEWEESCHC